MSLSTYWKKRKFNETSEPRGEIQKANKEKLCFVVQKHHASHLHYDFRLEMEGVLKSWAVPKGPSLNPEDRRLAMMVEDHPYDYRTFEGVIPEGNYGAGKVIIWDEGTYESEEGDEKTLLEGLKNGNIPFILHGKKLNGNFALVKLKKNDQEDKSWFLVKKKDVFASEEDITENANSVVTDRDVEEVGTDSIHNKKTFKKSPLPKEIKPMLASLVDKPFSSTDWIFEIKWDGYRAISQIQKNKIRLYSRNNNDYNTDYPKIVNSLKQIKHDVILDGEIVVTDKNGKSQFQLLQNYEQDKKGNLEYYIFDLLYLDGYDLRSQPLIERKLLLKDLIKDIPNIHYSDHIEEKGEEFFKVIKEKKLEGIIGKRKSSEYVSKRTDDWVKIKNIFEEEAIICGFTEPQGTRQEFGALLLGQYIDGELAYVGHTGSGFDTESLKHLKSLLEPLSIEESPFANAPKPNAPVTWVKPKIVCQVKYAERTESGMMRQAIFLGLRDDKAAKDVNPEKKVDINPEIVVSHADKIYWPQEKYTKGDMVEYYKKISKYILPYLKDRLQSLNRFPNGIDGENFYQKDVQNPPDYIKTIPLKRDDGKEIHYLLCDSENAMLYMANLGCIEMNPWNSRYNKMEYPDYLIMDLDPNDISFAETVRTAQCVKEILDSADIETYIKTSGKRGLHIFLPLAAKYNYDQTRQFAEILAHIIYSELHQTTSIVRDPHKRQKKVYIDFLQNRIGQTIAAPYSLRPIKGARVSTPLKWSEVNNKLSPDQFTIKTIFKRLKKYGDIWEDFRKSKGIDMLKSLNTLQKKYKV